MYNIDLLKTLKNKKIMVIGDVMLDNYYYGSVDRISPEAPVPVVLFKKEKFIPGGASNVAFNLLGLNINTILIGIIGKDNTGRKLLKTLKQRKNLNISGIVIDETRPTIEKLRIIGNHQQILRIDREDTSPVLKKVLSEIKNNIKENIKDIDAVILSDYGKGIISRDLIHYILELKKKYNFIVSVDPKIGHFFYYKEVDLITPNTKEASDASGIKIDDNKSVIKAAEKIISSLNCKNLLITLGADGMMLFNDEFKKGYHIPADAKNVYDVTGAGDTVISVMTAVMTTGVSVDHAARIANKAAGVVVSKFGTTAISFDELIDVLNH